MARGDLQPALGIVIDWELFGTGPDIVNAFEKREIDLAYVGLPPAIAGISRGVGIVCVAGGHVEGTVIAGGRKLAGFPEETDLHDILGQLKGKKIGVPGKGSIHDVILTDCLERLDLSKEIEILNFRWADQITEAMVRGDVSAAAGTPALATAIRRYADGRILFPPSRLWPNNPSYGIIVERNFLRKERELVERFLILHEEATSLIRQNPGRAARTVSDYVGFVDREFVLDTLRLSPKYCAQLTGDYISSTMEFVKVMKRLGYIGREVSAEEIFDTSLIRKIHPEKDHYSEGISDATE